MQGNDLKTVILDEDLSVRAAPTLFEALSKHAGLSLKINASGVKHLDAPCAQLLVAAKRASVASGSSFEIVTPSEKFLENLDTLGLTASMEPKLELSHVS